MTLLLLLRQLAHVFLLFLLFVSPTHSDFPPSLPPHCDLFLVTSFIFAPTELQSIQHSASMYICEHIVVFA